jgi:hypothetical protein
MDGDMFADMFGHPGPTTPGGPMTPGGRSVSSAASSATTPAASSATRPAAVVPPPAPHQLVPVAKASQKHLSCSICEKSSKDEEWAGYTIKRGRGGSVVSRQAVGDWCLTCMTTCRVGFPLLEPSDILGRCLADAQFKAIFLRSTAVRLGAAPRDFPDTAVQTFTVTGTRIERQSLLYDEKQFLHHFKKGWHGLLEPETVDGPDGSVLAVRIADPLMPMKLIDYQDHYQVMVNEHMNHKSQLRAGQGQELHSFLVSKMMGRRGREVTVAEVEAAIAKANSVDRASGGPLVLTGTSRVRERPGGKNDQDGEEEDEEEEYEETAAVVHGGQVAGLLKAPDVPAPSMKGRALSGAIAPKKRRRRTGVDPTSKPTAAVADSEPRSARKNFGKVQEVMSKLDLVDIMMGKVQKVHTILHYGRETLAALQERGDYSLAAELDQHLGQATAAHQLAHSQDLDRRAFDIAIRAVMVPGTQIKWPLHVSEEALLWQARSGREDPAATVRAFWPVGDADGEQFDPRSPRLASLACTGTERVEIFTRGFICNFFVGLVMQGTDQHTQVLETAHVFLDRYQDLAHQECARPGADPVFSTLSETSCGP